MAISTAVVLAAGEGTRLRPLTRNRPKPMLPAANQPILQHVLDALVESGIDRIVVVVGYRRERVQEHFGSRYRSARLEYVVQEKQLGSGHALLQARSVADGPLVVVNGDQLVDSEAVSRVVDAYEPGETVMAVVERPDANRYGVVRLEEDAVVELVEKPDDDAYRLINAGIYAFGPEIFGAIEETPRRDGELILPDTIERTIAAGSVRAVRTDGLWADATYPWDLLDVAEEVLAGGRTGSDPDGIWIDPDARVHEQATLQPPVVVGPDCEIGPSSVVGPTVALAENSTVGSNVTLSRVVVDADCRIGHGSTLLDAVLGQNVHLGPAVTVAGGPGDVSVGNRIFEEEALGAVLADRVDVGGGASFEPGSLVGPGVRVATGVVVGGNVGEGAEVRR